MVRIASFLIAASLLVISGVVAGLHGDRWGVSQARERAALAVASIPKSVGQWTSIESPLDPRQQQRAECDAVCSRVYQRTVHGEKQDVTLIVLSGRSQPMSVHTPDVCFQGAGYFMDGEPVRTTLTTADGSKHDVWSARFTRPPDPLTYQVFWAWSDGGPWQAPNDPRMTLRRAPALFKLYAVGVLPRRERLGNPAWEFLEELTPELQRRMTES